MSPASQSPVCLPACLPACRLPLQDTRGANPAFWFLRLLGLTQERARNLWHRLVPPATAAFLLSQVQGYREALLIWLTVGDGSSVEHSPPSYMVQQCARSLSSTYDHTSIVSEPARQGVSGRSETRFLLLSELQSTVDVQQGQARLLAHCMCCCRLTEECDVKKKKK